MKTKLEQTWNETEWQLPKNYKIPMYMVLCKIKNSKCKEAKNTEENQWAKLITKAKQTKELINNE